MKTTDLPETICKFIEQKNGTAILIDGPWGCGKTHSIKDAIELLKKEIEEAKKGKKNNSSQNNNNESNKDNSKKTDEDDGENKDNEKNELRNISLDHILYVSLFGLESINEIHTDIYQKYNKKLIKIKKAASGTLGVISKAASFFPISGIEETINTITSTLSDCGTSENKDLNRGSFIIFFDDLERLSKNISYADLLGYFSNRIFGFKGRIVCLSNQKSIPGDRIEEFNNFKEKIFDRIYEIDEDETSIFDHILNELHIENIQTTYQQFDSNIRLALKTKFFYKDLIGHIDEKFENYEKTFPKIDIFRTAITSIKEVLCGNKNSEETTSTINRFDTYEFLKPAIRKVFINNDYSFLYSLFNDYGFNKDTKIDQILNKKYFLLSDNNKEKYEEALTNMISIGNFSWSWGFQTQLGSVISENDNFVLNDFQLNQIAKKVIVWSNNHTGDPFSDFMIFANTKDFIEKIKEKVEQISNNKTEESLSLAFQNKDYSTMSKIIYDLYSTDEKENAYLDELFSNYNFYLPDISSDLSVEGYNYCILLSQLLNKNGSEKIKDSFEAKLNAELNKHPNNYTLKHRIDIFKSELKK